MDKKIVEEINNNLIPNLLEFVKIPNQSRLYIEDWENSKQTNDALNFCKDFAEKQGIKGLKCTIEREKGITPLLLTEINPYNLNEDDGTIFLYGHLDKQPPLDLNLWNEGLHPYKPVIKDEKMYGRGCADDGYAFFMYLIIIKLLQKENLKHSKIIIFMETDEESSSKDIKYYTEKFKDKIKNPKLISILDSGCIDYEHFFLTTNLRGNIKFTIEAQVLKEGIHSGDGSGVVPQPFDIIMSLLDRIEDSKTGKIIKDFEVNIPSDKYEMYYKLNKNLNGNIIKDYGLLEDVKLTESDSFKNYINRVFKPQLTVTGFDGLPQTSNAGNVINPKIKIQGSLRIPPLLNGKVASERLFEILSKNPPYNSKVNVEIKSYGNGFNCPKYDETFFKNLNEISKEVFNNEVLCYGEGGSIPFVEHLSSIYKNSTFIVSGILGPYSNAHGPNEMLDLNYLRKFSIVFYNIIKNVDNN